MKAWMWGAVAAGVAAVVTVVGINVVKAVDDEPLVAHGRTSQDSQSRNDAYLNYFRAGASAEGHTNQELLDAGYFVCKWRAEGKTDVIISYNLMYTYPNGYQRIMDGADQYLC